MDHLGVAGEFLQVACHPVVEAHSHGDQQVGIANCPIGEGGAVHPRHAQGKPVPVGEGPPTHQRGSDGHIDFFRQGQQFLVGLRIDDAAPPIQHRLFRRGDQFGGLLHCSRIGPPRQCKPADVDLVRKLQAVHRGLGNIPGHVNEDGTGATVGGDEECLLDDSRNLLGVPHLVAVFHDGQGDAHDVRFLEGVGADGEGRHLARDGHDRHRIQDGIGDSGYQVGRPRAGGGQAHPHFAGDFGVAFRHVRRALLMARQNVAEVLFYFEQSVIDGERCAPGNPKDDLHALPFQGFDQSVRTVHSSSLRCSDPLPEPIYASYSPREPNLSS